MKSMKLFLCIILGILVMAGCGRNSVPDESQLKADLIEEKLSDEDLSISTFSVESEQKNDNQYKAIAKVVYDNKEIEYERKYHFMYDKYDEWILNDIEEYEKESWTKKPLTAPTSDVFQNKCISELRDTHRYSEDTKFEYLDEKTETNLDEGKTTLVFMIEEETILQKESGEIEFYMQFDYEKGIWNIENYDYTSNYVVEHNLLHLWKGKGPHCGTQGSKIVEKEFALNITEYNDEMATGILAYEGKEYVVSGEISPTLGAGDTQYVLDMCNVNEKMRIDGSIDIEGEMYVTIDTAYVPDAMFYYLTNRYDVDMFIEE